MKTPGRSPKKTSDKSKSDSKKPVRKSLAKPSSSRSSDSKFKKTDNDSDFKKKSYSDSCNNFYHWRSMVWCISGSFDAGICPFLPWNCDRSILFLCATLYCRNISYKDQGHNGFDVPAAYYNRHHGFLPQ